MALRRLSCIVSMVAILTGLQGLSVRGFGTALLLMRLSLGFLIFEIFVSGGALNILLSKIENNGPALSSETSVTETEP